MIAHNESTGAVKSQFSEDHIPSLPHQHLVVTPFNLLNGTGWLRYPPSEVRAHSAELLFNLRLPGKSREVCLLIKRLGKRFPNCSVTVLDGKELSATAKQAHVRLVTPQSLRRLKCPHLLFHDD
jgi:hypothetical protein